jgi:hypothetical protein
MTATVLPASLKFIAIKHFLMACQLLMSMQEKYFLRSAYALQWQGVLHGSTFLIIHS